MSASGVWAKAAVTTKSEKHTAMMSRDVCKADLVEKVRVNDVWMRQKAPARQRVGGLCQVRTTVSKQQPNDSRRVLGKTGAAGFWIMKAVGGEQGQLTTNSLTLWTNQRPATPLCRLRKVLLNILASNAFRWRGDRTKIQ